jgi:hypothetical protein
MGSPANLTTGPGVLNVAPYLTTLPTAAGTALGTAFNQVGYTEEGYAFTLDRTMEGMYVAEKKRPIKHFVTEMKESIVFAMAEATSKNLTLAINKGAVDETTFDADAVITPPADDAEVRVSIVFDAANGARWVFKKCINAGTTEMARRKAPNKMLIPVEFMVEEPDDESSAWLIYPNAAGLI